MPRQKSVFSTYFQKRPHRFKATPLHTQAAAPTQKKERKEEDSKNHAKRTKGKTKYG